jgi:N-acetylmuramoyl-L-alanine amidase
MKLRKGLATFGVYLLIIGTALAGVYGGNWATQTVSSMIPMPRVGTVVIDAGHGGVDGGATSCTGVPESRINLEIALRLEDLCHLLGYRTVMIRRTDVSVYTSGDTIAAKKVSDLRQRVRIVNETENSVLVSIHQNTFSDSQYSGAQVFYGKEEGSRELAECIQSSFVTLLNPGSNRAAKPAEGVYLMQNITRPGILVECGFLSNPEEEAKLRDKAYQQKLCAILAASVGEFLTK